VDGTAESGAGRLDAPAARVELGAAERSRGVDGAPAAAAGSVQRGMMFRASLVAVGMLAGGCYMAEHPGSESRFLSGGDVQLAAALRAAASDWSHAGLVAADAVTVDAGRAGMAVRFASRAELAEACPDDLTVRACTYWENGDWLGMLIWEGTRTDAEMVRYLVRHELVHALVPDAEHLPDSVPAVFTAARTSDSVTAADLQHLSVYAEVVTRAAAR